jgi:hypothetical protein
MTMKIVVISGKMHSGKSFVAGILEREHGYRRLSFAQPLKDDLRHMGFTEAEIDSKGEWMRKLMQAYGQARRAQHPDYWSNRLVERLETELHYERQGLFNVHDEVRLVIDDMRFENEANALDTFNMQHTDVELFMIRLEREGYDRSMIPNAQDESETGLDHYDRFDMRCDIESGDLDGLRGVAHDIAGWR